MPPERHISASPKTHPRVRQRSRRACEPCRKRKVKCDGTEPCGPCVGYGYECVYLQRKAPRLSSPSGSGSVAGPSPASTSFGTSSNHIAPTAARSPSHNVVNTIALPSASALNLTDKPDGSFITSETVVPQSQDGHLLYQSIKTRFTSSSSTIAFPKILGTHLGLPDPPRLHSFGWNPGTRPENKYIPQTNISNIISLGDAKRFADAYFRDVHPFFAIVDQTLFTTRIFEFWRSQRHGTDFEALICHVVILGSYFCHDDKCLLEAEVAEHGRKILELSTAHPPVLLSVNHVAGWILRTIYLRCTTRPHIAWMASCTAMHVAESLGLHRDVDESLVKRAPPRLFSPLEADLRRRTFWVGMALNQFLSVEYGRTKVYLDGIDCKPLEPRDGDMTTRTILLMQSVPGKRVMDETELDPLSGLDEALRFRCDAPFLAVLRADVCFCNFRVARSKNLTLSEAQVTSLLDVIRMAMDGVKFLRSLQTPWWNVLGTPFHAVCVILSIRNSAAFAMLPSVLETLKNIASLYDSYLSREALQTVTALVEGARRKMTGELDSLNRSVGVVGELGDVSMTGNASVITPVDFEWAFDGELGASDFLDFSGAIDFGGQSLIS